MKKLVNKKGFTLMEMLIVVAIIAILVAISIPTFSGSLDKANAATDKANFRAAKAVVVNSQLDPTVTATEGQYYNVESGAFQTGFNDNCKGKCKNHENAYIKLVSGAATWVDSQGNALDSSKQDCSK